MEFPRQSNPRGTPDQPTGIVLIGDEKRLEPYLRALGELDRVRVIGILDRSRRRRDARATVQSTDDPATALAWAGGDAFIHCGPLANDPESAATIAAAGKPMFVDSRGGRHRADARTVRACIEAGEMGRVVFARFAAGNRPDDTATTTRSGNPLAWQQRAQILDVLGWWIGDSPEAVYAQRASAYESVTVRYAEGATAVCDITSAGPAYREVVVVGTSASMSLTWSDHAGVLVPANGDEAESLDGSPSLDAVLDEWLDNVRAGTAPITDASELDAAVALEEAIERSVTSGREADVKSPRGGSQA